MLADRFRDGHEDHARLLQLLLERGRHRHRVEHGIDGNAAIAVGAFPVAVGLLHAQKNLLLAQGNAELLVGLEDLGVDLVERLERIPLGRGIIIDVLVVDRPVIDARPFRLALRQPVTIGFEPPVQHPFGLVLLRRDEANRIFGQALGGLFRFDQRLEPVLVLIDIDAADLVHRLLHGRHISLRSRFQGPRVGLVGYDFVSAARVVLSPGRPHAAMPCVLLGNARTSLFQASRKQSTSSSLVENPRLTRIAPAPRRGPTPMAVSTCEAATLPDEQADPDDTATPARSRAISAVSALTPGTAKKVVLGNRSTPAPKITAPGEMASKPASSRSRNATILARSSDSPAAAAADAAPKAAIPPTFSVPARPPRSCPPPLTSGSPRCSVSSRRTRAPTPLGPPSLWAEIAIRSAPISLMLQGIFPTPCTASTCRSPPARCTSWA